MRDNIVDHMSANNLFAEEQHGFVPGRSCMTQLLAVIEEWTATLEEGKPLDAAYLDFSKAFDSVPHERLAVKLEAYGIQGDCLRWIRKFLSNRRQRVVVNRCHSEWAPVTSGIPQGSVLGPILFVIYINDLPEAVESPAKIFADDTKIYRPVPDEDESRRFQMDITSLCNWSHKWQLPFNATKCKIMHMGNMNQHYTYNMDGNALEPIREEKDLGVTVDADLKFHSHTTRVVNKANRILGMIKKSFVSLDAISLPVLYKAFIRPHLEYGNVIWGPHFRDDQIKVERVQRRATKLIDHLRDLPYEERLNELKLPSLYYRRRRGDMIQVFKIMKGFNRVPKEQFFKQKALTTRGHHLKLFKPRAQKLVRRQFFSTRIINDWNQLPSDIVEADTVNTFKARLDRHWVNFQNQQTEQLTPC